MIAVNLGLHAFLQILFVSFLLLPCTACIHAEAAADPLPELEKIAKDYRIEIVTSGIRFPLRTTHGMIQGRNADRSELQEYVRLFTSEFTLYPPALVEQSQLKTVVLCCDLTFDGQPRGGIPDYEHDTLFLDIGCGMYDETYMRKAIHHEFFHIIDYRDDGSVYEDERWARLNPTNAGYGNGGVSAQGLPETSLLTDKFPGFLNHYSTTGVEEDKAEMFANLIVEPEHVEESAQQDPVLRDKLKLMKEILERFSPLTNDGFWQTVRKMERADR